MAVHVRYKSLYISLPTTAKQRILGHPWATSRDDAIFSAPKFTFKSPREFILTEPVPKVFEFRPANWQKNIFLANQREGPAGRLSASYLKWFSSSSAGS